MSDVSREELLRRLYDPQLVVVDVLPPDSWGLRHIPGAINLPVDEIKSRAAAVLPDRDREIILYCGTST